MWFKRGKIRQTDPTSGSIGKTAWRRFKKDKMAMFGMIILVISIFVSILGSLIRPDQTEDVAQQIPSIEFQSPGFKTTILKERLDHMPEYNTIFDRMFFGGKVKKYKNYAIYDDYEFDGPYIKFREFHTRKTDPETEIEDIAKFLYPLDYNNKYVYIKNDAGEVDSVSFIVIGEGEVVRSVKDMQNQLVEENIFERTYWLGTAKHGRDMLSLIMASIIVSLTVGLIAVLISVTVGITLGAIAGYFRGWVDDVIMYFVNVIWSIPLLLIVIALSVSMGRGLQTVCVSIGAVLWVEVARIVRGQVLSVREKEFVEASRALGYGSTRIIFKHVLPNVMGPVIVIAAANFASAILIESGLSFLGVGTQPPQPSLGALVSEYRTYVTNDKQAYLAILPSAMIVILVLAFMLIGNGIRDAFDNRAVESSPSVDPSDAYSGGS